MNRPLIFKEYDFHRAEVQFPLISIHSSDKFVEDTAWQYTYDLLSNDSMYLHEAFVGEYLSSSDVLNAYQQRVLLAVMEQNYEEVGKLVESSIGAFNQLAVDYINEHKAQLEMRYE